MQLNISSIIVNVNFILNIMVIFFFFFTSSMRFSTRLQYSVIFIAGWCTWSDRGLSYSASHMPERRVSLPSLSLSILYVYWRASTRRSRPLSEHTLSHLPRWTASPDCFRVIAEPALPSLSSSLQCTICNAVRLAIRRLGTGHQTLFIAPPI